MIGFMYVRCILVYISYTTIFVNMSDGQTDMILVPKVSIWYLCESTYVCAFVFLYEINPWTRANCVFPNAPTQMVLSTDLSISKSFQICCPSKERRKTWRQSAILLLFWEGGEKAVELKLFIETNFYKDGFMWLYKDGFTNFYKDGFFIVFVDFIKMGFGSLQWAKIWLPNSQTSR